MVQRSFNFVTNRQSFPPKHITNLSLIHYFEHQEWFESHYTVMYISHSRFCHAVHRFLCILCIILAPKKFPCFNLHFTYFTNNILCWMYICTRKDSSQSTLHINHILYKFMLMIFFLFFKFFQCWILQWKKYLFLQFEIFHHFCVFFRWALQFFLYNIFLYFSLFLLFLMATKSFYLHCVRFRWWNYEIYEILTTFNFPRIF